MPHRQIIRDAFGPEEIDIAVRAYERALNFLKATGDADDDPDVERNLAIHIVETGKQSPGFSYVDLTNRAIARYKVQRANAMVSKARSARLKQA